jgi:hypothetical protein
MSQGPGGPASASLVPPELLELLLEPDPEAPLLELELPELLPDVDPDELPLELELPELLPDADPEELPLEADPEELPFDPELPEVPLELDPDEPLLELELLPDADPEELELEPDELPLELDADMPPLEPLLAPDALASGVAFELSSLEPQEQKNAVRMATGKALRARMTNPSPSCSTALKCGRFGDTLAKSGSGARVNIPSLKRSDTSAPATARSIRPTTAFSMPNGARTLDDATLVMTSARTSAQPPHNREMTKTYIVASLAECADAQAPTETVSSRYPFEHRNGMSQSHARADPIGASWREPRANHHRFSSLGASRGHD